MTVPAEVLTLAERGAKLFPLSRNTKAPIPERWQLDNNTSDLGQLKTWAGQYPHCNWGMLCGTSSGLWVLDFDCKKGKPGLEQYQKWLEEYGTEWADTLKVRTVSGGLHLYFRWQDGIHIPKDNTGKLAQGVDVQGDKSYVVVP